MMKLHWTRGLGGECIFNFFYPFPAGTPPRSFSQLSKQFLLVNCCRSLDRPRSNRVLTCVWSSRIINDLVKVQVVKDAARRSDRSEHIRGTTCDHILLVQLTHEQTFTSFVEKTNATAIINNARKGKTNNLACISNESLFKYFVLATKL